MEQISGYSGIGRPPLARSRRGHLRGTDGRHRDTSARAEPTCGQPSNLAGPAGHLRSRGAGTCVHCPTRSDSGTPPLARSLLCRGHRRRRADRGTSARAEPTSGCPSSGTRAPGYLRSRGADNPNRTDGQGGYGTPPLARSRQRRLRGGLLPRRDTSACAEPTRRWRRPRPGGSRHFRSRGADLTVAGYALGQDGMPPLARTPTPPPSSLPSSTAGHPHSRGADYVVAAW